MNVLCRYNITIKAGKARKYILTYVQKILVRLC